MNSFESKYGELRTSMVGEGTPPCVVGVSHDTAEIKRDPSKVITLHPEVISAAALPVEEPAGRPTQSSVFLNTEAVLCEEDVVAVRGCVDALYVLLEAYGYHGRHKNPTSMRSFERTVAHWSEASRLLGEGGWMKWAKYKFAAFFHASTRQEDVGPEYPLPGFPDFPHVLCCGSAGRFIRLLLSSTFRHSFLASVLQVKKGCPRPSEKMVAAAVLKAFTALTTVRKQKKGGFLIEWGDIVDSYDDVLLTEETMKAQLVRTVKELFTRPFTDDDRYKMIFPSVSASFDTTKERGGKWADVNQFLHRSGRVFDPVAEGKVSDRNELYELGADVRFTRPSFVDIKQITAHVDEFGQWDNGVRDEDEYIGKGNRTFQFDLRRLEEYNRAIYQLLDELLGRTEISQVECVGLAESLKVRVITKGQGLMSEFLHPLQKFMWKTLFRHKTFQLIGTPVTPWIVQDVLGAKLKPGEFYLSGDYSAATDNLAPWVSETIGKAIAECCGLSATERKLLLMSLTGNHFKPPHGVSPRYPTPQRWGQLMGSIVSFPVLCIANAAMCRWAIELTRGRRVSLDNSGLLINGDDVVFKTTKAGYELWKRITAFGGLESSIGKTFLSDEFAQINSMNFRRLEEPLDVHFHTIERGDFSRQLWFEQTPYVNLGLLFGLKRSGESVGADAIADADITFGARCRELIKFCPEELRYNVMALFIRHHRKVLDQAGACPWFVPEEFGGVGLPTVITPEEDRDGRRPAWGPTDLDLKIAQRISEMPRRSDGKLKYPVGRIPAKTVWEVHRVVMSMLPDCIVYGNPSPEEERTYNIIYGAMCYNTVLMDADIWKGTKNVSAIHARQYTAVLKQNRRSWRNALRDGNLPTHPMSAEVLFSKPLPKPFIQGAVIVSVKPEVGAAPCEPPPDDELYELRLAASFDDPLVAQRGAQLDSSGYRRPQPRVVTHQAAARSLD